MIAHRSERPSRPEAGFSFIEILIVMGIISVLVGMVVIALKIWGEKKPEMETRDRARSVTLLLEGWKGTFDGMYPPTRLVDLAKIAGNSAVKAIKGGGNSINEGIETVFQALYFPGFSTDANLSDDALCNSDEDKLSEPIGSRGPALMEIKDGYGNPFFYFNSHDYASADKNPPTYRMLAGDLKGEDVQPRPWKSENGGFEQPNTFQVFSAGRDGVPNTEDDVKGWTSK